MMRKKPMLAYPVSAKPIDYSKPTFIQPKLDECIFVGLPNKLITTYGSQLDESYYKLNTNDDG